MDPLSDVLSILRPQHHTAYLYDVGPGHSVGFPAFRGIKGFMVISGQGWLDVDGIPDPVRLESGDFCLLSQGRPFRFATEKGRLGDPRPPTAPIHATASGTITILGGGACLAVGVHFLVSAAFRDSVSEVLPAVIHITKASDGAFIRWALESLVEELRRPALGGRLVAENLTSILLVQALRVHLAQGRPGSSSWLAGLADEKLRRALVAIHGTPSRNWTLQELAACAGMSRTPFAERFRLQIGQTVMGYTTTWKMLLAADQLVHTDRSVAEIGAFVGYRSESAFCVAFKRVHGTSPRHFGRTGASTGPAPRQRHPVPEQTVGERDSPSS